MYKKVLALFMSIVFLVQPMEVIYGSGVNNISVSSLEENESDGEAKGEELPMELEEWESLQSDEEGKSDPDELDKDEEDISKEKEENSLEADEENIADDENRENPLILKENGEEDSRKPLLFGDEIEWTEEIIYIKLSNYNSLNTEEKEELLLVLIDTHLKGELSPNLSQLYEKIIIGIVKSGYDYYWHRLDYNEDLLFFRIMFDEIINNDKSYAYQIRLALYSRISGDKVEYNDYFSKDKLIDSLNRIISIQDAGDKVVELGGYILKNPNFSIEELNVISEELNTKLANDTISDNEFNIFYEFLKVSRPEEIETKSLHNSYIKFYIHYAMYNDKKGLYEPYASLYYSKIEDIIEYGLLDNDNLDEIKKVFVNHQKRNIKKILTQIAILD